MRYRQIFTTIALFVATGLHLSAQTLAEKYTEDRPVVIVCDWDKPPYEFLDDNGDPAGSNISVMTAVMKQLKLPFKFVMKEWSIALKTFERGNADIILANGRRYRKGNYVISDNIVNYNRICAAMFADSVEMVTLQQLEREGAVFKPGDYSAYYFVKSDSGATGIMEFQTPKVALTGLINGDYKYYIWGEEPLKWKIKELNLEGITLNDVGIPISEIHIVGHDRQLIEQIDDQYSRLKQSGEVASLQDKWLHPERAKEESNSYIFYIIATALLLAAIIYFFNRLARRHVMIATRASTELNEMMYQALHMGNFIVMEYDIANDRVTNRYGSILPDNGLTLEEFTNKIHPDQRHEFRQKTRALLDGRERRFELNKRWNSGTEEEPNWLNFHGHAITELDSNGRPAYIFNAIHDVTAEMEEDQAARDLIHKYDTLSNMPFASMSFYSKDGFLIDLNDNMKELCGISEETPDTKRFWEKVCMFDVPLFKGVYSPDDRNDILFCQHMSYPELSIDKFIECSISPLLNAEGDIVNYFITAFNLSEERYRDKSRHILERETRNTKERIQLQHERLKYLLIHSERHLIRSNIEQQTISFYRSPEKPEYTHSFEHFLSILDEQDREPVRQLLNDTTTRESRHYTIHVLEPSEGQPGVIFDLTFNPITSQEGEIIGHEGISTDITRLYTTHEQLEKQTQRANESVRLKSGFMASMTHELRTPLNAIVGFTGVLEALGDSPERAEYVRIIRNSSDMLQRLINDIIEASSISDDAYSIVPVETNFAEMFDDMCITLAQRVQGPDVEFQKENPYNTFYTSIDTERILQILTNFVTNAVKFTKKGHIKVGYRYESHGLYLYCEDTGIGIPEEKQRVVFDRFVKLDEFVQGTGMGLAICKSIVKRCNGDIGVHSEGQGKGSTFWAWIPCERKLS